MQISVAAPVLPRIPVGELATLQPSRNGSAAAVTALMTLEESAYTFWERKSAAGALPSIPLLPKGAAKLTAYDPALYPGQTCEAFCSGDVAIDVVAAKAAGRTTFPSNGLADWNVRCHR